MKCHPSILPRAAALLVATACLSLWSDEGRKLEAIDARLKELEKEVQRALDASKAELDAARRELEATAPKLQETLQDMAEKARKLHGQTTSRAMQVAEKDQPQPEAAEELRREQKRFNRELKQLQEDLRRDANAQDQTTNEGREHARDNDAGMEMLQQPAEKAQTALDKAADRERRE